MSSLRELALAQLDAFVNEQVLRYAEQRNIDRGPQRHHSVSRLSAAIRHRVLLEEEVLLAVLAKHSFESVEKFVHEVCWRTYWKGWLQTNPQVWVRYVQSRDEQARIHAEPSAASRGLGNALRGRTGIECFDAWSLELVSSGYLHNHARMWFASIWIFTLKLPWQLGADFFMRHLVDADPASNTLSWRWVAGLHTPGKHYLARAENILRNTEGRFDPRGQLNESAVAMSESASASESASDFEPRRQPWRAPVQVSLPASDAATALLLTEDDLQGALLVSQFSPRLTSPRLTSPHLTSPYLSSPSLSAPRLVIAVREPAARSLRSQGSVAAEYVRRASSEAAIDAAANFACPLVSVDTLNSRAAIVEACAQAGVNDLVTPHVPVGPTLVAITELQAALSVRHINLHQLLRRWDQQAWPYCARGFFQFRERIPEILINLQASHSSSSDPPASKLRQRSLSNLVGKR